MSTSPELISKEAFYRQGGVELSIAPDRVLSYSKGGRIVRRTFESGRLDRTGFIDWEAGLNVFYDTAWESWVIVHTRPHEHGESSQEWWTDTIFLPDNGNPYVKQGFSPVTVRILWPYSMTFLLAGTLLIAFLFWLLSLWR